MKVLLVHEYYRSSAPSGEDRVFENEKKLLEYNGIDVQILKFENDSIGSPDGPSVFKAALYTPWSPIGVRQIKSAIKSFNPDVVHFHNTFPVLSQSAIYQAKKMGVATVQTFHNFRSICANAMLMGSDGICEECIGTYPYKSISRRCYRNSLLATVPLALNIALNRYRRTWQTQIDRFIVLSEFNRNKFVEAGFPEHKLCVKPNFFNDTDNFNVSKDGSWIFVGRLSKEKGVHLLPQVWKKLGEVAPVLNVVGSGPLYDSLKNDIENECLGSKVILHGQCRADEVELLLARASLMVFPSVWFEPFGLVIGEAYRQAVPVAASKIGTPAFTVKDGYSGVHFISGDVDDMTQKLKYVIDNKNQLDAWSHNARKEYEDFYSPARNFERLIEIYNEAISENQSRCQ